LADAARDIALGILARARTERTHASDLMQQAFRATRLGPRQRRDVAEGVYAVLRAQRLLDWALARVAGPGAKALDGTRRDLGRWLASGVLAGAVSPAAARAELGGYDWAGLAAAVAAAGDIPDVRERLAVTESLPDWLAARLLAECGAEAAAALAHALNQRAPMIVRCNRVKTTREALLTRLAAEGVEARATSLAPDGIELMTRVNAFGLASFTAGDFEVQDEGSQLVAELVAPPPRGVVVDACAGAGGKTLHLAALLGNKGRVIAFDVPPQAERKLEELRRRARRAGLSNVEALEVPVNGALPPAAAKLVGRADRVLCDAPCSGLGVLRRNPEARWRLTEADLARLPGLQGSILDRFAPLVAIGGRLIYATCTITRSENDDVVAAFLARTPGFVAMAAKEILGTPRALAIGDGQALRVAPHTHGTDGFFATVLRRTS